MIRGVLSNPILTELSLTQNFINSLPYTSFQHVNFSIYHVPYY